MMRLPDSACRGDDISDSASAAKGTTLFEHPLDRLECVSHMSLHKSETPLFPPSSRAINDWLNGSGLAL
jgi:hypothetical protein